MDEHLAREEQEGNHRNGYSSKTVHADSSSLELAISRDRQGNFEPQLVEKHCRRMPGFDRKVIALYARGMSTRDIQSHIEEIYGVEISPSLVSRVTEEVSADIAAWQNRPLDSSYPFVFFDGTRVKTRYEGRVVNMVIYVALAINNAGRKELLGLWLFPTESAKLWQQVFADLANRGVNRIFYAIVDNLPGITDADLPCRQPGCSAHRLSIPEKTTFSSASRSRKLMHLMSNCLQTSGMRTWPVI